MALSTTISNFFSFLSPPSKSSPQLPLLSSFPSHNHHNNHRNNKLTPPLVLSRSETSSSVTSSPPENLSSSFTSSSSSSQPPQTQELSSSSFPSSLSTSNSAFLTSPFNVQIVVEDDEPEERMLGRFRREVMRAGIIQEFKRRRFFENKQDEKKRRVRDAAKRNRRNRFPRRPVDGESRGSYNNYRQDVPVPEKEEDDDNWDLAEEDVLTF